MPEPGAGPGFGPSGKARPAIIGGVVPNALHNFFAASTSVAGALIGLLFVAISVSAERLAREDSDTQLHRIRASAALTAFGNTLVISMFALIPGQTIGLATLVVAVVGLLFVIASLLSLIRLRLHAALLGDGVFLAGLAVVLAFQLDEAFRVLADPHDTNAMQTIAALLVICALIGIARSWELIGGPRIALWRELGALARAPRPPAPPADPPASSTQPLGRPTQNPGSPGGEP